MPYLWDTGREITVSILLKDEYKGPKKFSIINFIDKSKALFFFQFSWSNTVGYDSYTVWFSDVKRPAKSARPRPIWACQAGPD